MLEEDEAYVTAAIQSDFLEKAREAERKGADALEVRVDMYDSEALEALRRYEGGLPIIVTNRPNWEGGEFPSESPEDEMEEERIDELLEAIEYAEAVDIELEANQEYQERVRDKALEEDAKVIASYHDFDKTPENDGMRYVLDRGLEVGDVAKMAVKAQSREDAQRLLNITRDYSDENIATMAMGEKGSYTRFMAPEFGSMITYGAIDDEGTAPGQLTVEELDEVIEILNGDR
jgi:3-dehydroquinate dehydratase-1